MSKYDDNNSIALYKNDKYEAGGNKPIYKGKAKFNGQELNCSVWLREASGEGKMEKGTKFLSGTFDDWKPDASRGNQSQGSNVTAMPQSIAGLDDIPF
jgi:hypothetical protein